MASSLPPPAFCPMISFADQASSMKSLRSSSASTISQALLALTCRGSVKFDVWSSKWGLRPIRLRIADVGLRIEERPAACRLRPLFSVTSVPPW
jgi:hypothetical protein